MDYSQLIETVQIGKFNVEHAACRLVQIAVNCETTDPIPRADDALICQANHRVMTVPPLIRLDFQDHSES